MSEHLSQAWKEEEKRHRRRKRLPSLEDQKKSTGACGTGEESGSGEVGEGEVTQAWPRPVLCGANTVKQVSDGLPA